MGFKQVIVVRKDLKLTPGKLSIQVAHASVLAAMKTMDSDESDFFEEWMDSGMKKVVVKIETQNELFELYEKVKKKLPAALIKDAGLTQLAPGTATCFAFWPVPEKMADEFTKNLKLL